jgi:hypothetical protein
MDMDNFYENLSANQETLPDLEWFENLGRGCEAGTFFEVIVNNVKNNVLKVLNSIYKIKNNRKKTLCMQLKDLKQNYMTNQAQIFSKEKELSILIESELKAELTLMKGFERLNDEKITPHFLKLAKNTQQNPNLNVINVPDEDKLTGDVALDRENYIKKFYAELYSKPVNENTTTVNSITEFLGPEANCDEVINAKLTAEEAAELESPFTVCELDIAINKCKKNSAPGQDGINNRFIRTF